jgi:transposase-like protein
MRRHIDESTKKTMVAMALKSTVGPRKTADYLGVALSTVYAVVRKARLTGQVVSKARCPGRLRILNALDLNVSS